jgi:hypothetical protein
MIQIPIILKILQVGGPGLSEPLESYNKSTQLEIDLPIENFKRPTQLQQSNPFPTVQTFKVKLSNV